ncbi:hypothetical protein Sinac_4358 [Singulisphaera acidiphila DSM 18658]|uniref:ATP-grasp domain-containing protein n=1 Tax=Singulisphaera acidiphila (strain ATCC BAA-1392 / DSM 18658 / VKM B-2454 / MOB10) TaxID=886293 RepID=L0DGP8_SINAD|nr:hypothetical protein Sinac_4358 [Singulisphaera acidiphila DSM 18658]
MESILHVGLDEPETSELRGCFAQPVLAFETLPRIQVDRGRLMVEHPHRMNQFVPIGRAVFHAIFEDDFDFITALALWGGPCLPGARGMMDLRHRLPGLVRAMAVTRFGQVPRGYADRGTIVVTDSERVAKWGNWHCGEDKSRFSGSWNATQPTLFEEYVEGEAVRIVLVGERAWQVRMAGDGWLKSIHHQNTAFMPIDPELLDDSRRLATHFGLEVVSVDYILAPDGSRHLLEVNHVPNVTVFPEVRGAYLDLVVEWASEDSLRSNRLR